MCINKSFQMVVVHHRHHHHHHHHHQYSSQKRNDYFIYHLHVSDLLSSYLFWTSVDPATWALPVGRLKPEPPLPAGCLLFHPWQSLKKRRCNKKRSTVFFFMQPGKLRFLTCWPFCVSMFLSKWSLVMLVASRLNEYWKIFGISASFFWSSLGR